jgi:hypothetical protein
VIQPGWDNDLRVSRFLGALTIPAIPARISANTRLDPI